MTQYYQATLEIHSSKRAQFMELMKEFVPLMESFQFKLLGGYANATGRMGGIVHIWEIPDANAFGRGVAQFYAHPDFKRIASTMYECVISETITLLNKTPYSP